MRAVDRYYVCAVGLSGAAPASPAASQIAGHTVELNELADEVHDRLVEAQQRFPSDSLTLPARARDASGDLPRRVSQASTHIATAAEAATMARVALRSGDEAGAMGAAASAAASIARAAETLA